MAPPLVKGRALARQRVAGLVFIAFLAASVWTSAAIYQKKFSDSVDVVLEAGRVGNQLSIHADVKVRGIPVGEVRSIDSRGDKAVLRLALDPEKASQVPADVQAQLLPKTLFGEKEVQLVIPSGSSGVAIRDGAVISQDRSTTALETETALNDLLPVLRSLEPQKLSMTLNAVSAALRDRGDALGQNFARTAAYLKQLNPEVPELGDDLGKLALVARDYAVTTPDLVRVLDNLSFSSRSLIDQRQELDAFLRRFADTAATTRAVVAENEQRFKDLARLSRPVLNLYGQYAGGYPCLLDRIAFAEIEGERTFGGDQPGLQITLELTQDQGGYAPGDEPQNKERRFSNCYGLGSKPIIPFPSYRQPQDGYHDGDPAETPNSGPDDDGEPPPPPGEVTGWQSSFAGAASKGSVVRSMPRGTTALDGLLLAPLLGAG